MTNFKIKKFLTEDEYSDRLRKIESPRDYLMFNTLWELALRVSEVANLRIEHIDFNSKMVKIYSDKTNKERPLPLSDGLIREIRLFIGSRKSGLIFDIKRKQIYNLSKQYFGINPHAIRHSRAIYLVTHGVSVETTRRVLGHSRLDITQIYLDYDYETMRKDLANANNLMVINKESKL